MPFNFQGVDYTIRAYPGDRYLGITSTGAVYGLGDFTGGQLASFGSKADYAALALADAQAQAQPVSVMVVSDIGPGEQFRFVMNELPAIVTSKGSAVAFAGTQTGGSSYTVSQTDGPRSCVASSNRSGTIGFKPVVVAMDCGRPPGQSALAGQLHAPVGTQLTLQLNGGADLALTMPAFAGSADPYNLLPFSFASTLSDGTAYEVTVKSAPAGQVCSVYKGATGTMPVALGGLRVGCEWRDDRVSRSTDNKSFGTFFRSQDYAIGGASGPVGRTADGYGEGRFITFVSDIAGIGGSKGAHRQAFWRDRLTGETLMISATTAGVEGNGDSFAPALSADGLTVAFESYASNLAAADNNGTRDIFVWRANARELGPQRISVGPGGIESNSESFEPTISGDGRRVAYTSSASTLTPGVENTSVVNVILRDLDSGANTLVTANAAGKGVGGSRPALSEDGNRLAFYSFSSQLVAGDANGLWDIFVYSVDSASMRRVSFTTAGGERNQGNESASRVVAPAISGNGRYVAFSTTATNMAAGDTNSLQDVYVADLQTNTVQHASAGVGGAAGSGDSPFGQGERVSLSYDGRWIAFTTGATNLGVQSGQIVLRNLDSGETRAIGTAGSSTANVRLSRSAAAIAFGTNAFLDARYSGSGMFVEPTGIGRSWWWFD
jgi:Tol biopolymer transport system component